jgi:hypothetical protein
MPGDESTRECANCREHENKTNGVHLMECGRCKVRVRMLSICVSMVEWSIVVIRSAFLI